MIDGVPIRRFEERSKSSSWEQSPNVEGITPICKFNVILVYVPLQLWLIKYDSICIKFFSFF
jgi:hypothetical protein